MCSGPAVAGAWLGGMGGAMEASARATAHNQAMEFNAVIKDREAKLLGIQAEQADIVGKQELTQFRRETEQLKGEQRVGFAAAGVLVDEGSALDTLLNTAEFAELDALNLKRNAEIEAWNFRYEEETALMERDHYTTSIKDPDDAAMEGFILGMLGGSASYIGSSSYSGKSSSNGMKASSSSTSRQGDTAASAQSQSGRSSTYA